MAKAKDLEVSTKLDWRFKPYCPNCFEVCEITVKVTDGNRHTLSGSISMMLEFLKKPLWYLKRTRVCGKCGHEFPTVEMPREDLYQLYRSLKELYDFKRRAEISQSQYERAKQKIKDLQHEVDSLKQHIIDLEAKYKQLANYVEAAPIEHNSSSEENETYVENEEKDGDHLSE